LHPSPLGTATNPNNPNKNPEKLYPVPARNSCNIHGHHNRNHCTIIHLNTRNFRNYSSRFYTLPRSDNPLQKTRASSQRCSHIHKNQHTRPDAPKPIHPDKEQFALDN